MKLPINAAFATASAWRAIYLRRRARMAGHQGGAPSVIWYQFFYMGVDPSGHRGPEFFGGIQLRPGGLQRNWRVVCPHVAWRFNAGRAHKLAYAVSSRFWRSLDGRYGALRPGLLLRLRSAAVSLLRTPAQA